MKFVGEIGINHNGDLTLAKKLIYMAKRCGCDAVKFQKRNIDVVYTQEFLDQDRESPWGVTQREQKEGLEFGQAEYEEINKYCKSMEIDWFASAWDETSQLFLSQFDLKYNKVASAMLTHKPLLKRIAEEQKMTFISTGLSTTEQIDRAVNLFEENKCEYVLMHTTSIYPCPDELVNLQRITWLRKQYGRKMYFKGVGYSGHEVGITPSLLAVSLGASTIERHITLDRASYGSDQSASLEERGLQTLIREAKLVPQMLTGNSKEIEAKEKVIAEKLRYWDNATCLKG